MVSYNWSTGHYGALDSSGLGEEVVCTPPQGGEAVTVPDAIWMDDESVGMRQDGVTRKTQEADVILRVSRLPRADVGMTLSRTATGLTATAIRVERLPGNRWLCRVGMAEAIETTAGLYRPRV